MKAFAPHLLFVCVFIKVKNFQPLYTENGICRSRVMFPIDGQLPVYLNRNFRETIFCGILYFRDFNRQV